jgi:hypothetical protein
MFLHSGHGMHKQVSPAAAAVVVAAVAVVSER